MKHWKTNDVIAMLASLPCTVTASPPGGDYDTENLQLTPNGAGPDEFLHVAGFRCDEPLTDAADAEIEMVFVSDGQDSGGGLSSADPATCRLYAEVLIKLRGAGFSVVPSMDEYF